jgi:catechol 2,3-dioxygenase-like lactoylglutathione lyase family enzyme
MDFVSLRVITADPARLAAFYEKATGVPASWATEDFAELRTPHASLALAHARTLAAFAPDACRPGANASAIIEFRVPDVDALPAALPAGTELVAAPTTMPWGNRSCLVRDPDGNLVNFFTPVSEAARAKYGLAESG